MQLILLEDVIVITSENDKIKEIFKFYSLLYRSFGYDDRVVDQRSMSLSNIVNKLTDQDKGWLRVPLMLDELKEHFRPLSKEQIPRYWWSYF